MGWRSAAGACGSAKRACPRRACSIWTSSAAPCSDGATCRHWSCTRPVRATARSRCRTWMRTTRSVYATAWVASWISTMTPEIGPHGSDRHDPDRRDSSPPPLPAAALPERRLHPMSWLFVLLQQLKQFIVPLIALLIFGRGDRNELWPLIGVGVLVLVSLWQYFTYRYGVSGDS